VGALTLNALAAASFVVAPLFPAAESLHGLSMIADTVDDVRQINPELKMAATYISYHRSQTNLTRDVQNAAAHLFPDAALQAHIRVDVNIPRSYLAQQPVLIFAAESRAAQDYRAVASEIAERIGLINNAS
jgi:chromosome partitioning protein